MSFSLLGPGIKIGGKIDSLGGYSPDVAGGTGDGISNFTKFATNLFGFLTTLAGLMFLLYFVLGGLKWITAGGDKGKVEEAQKQMTNAAIGLIVVVAAYGIAMIIGGVLGLQILNPSKVLESITPGSSSSSIYDDARVGGIGK